MGTAITHEQIVSSILNYLPGALTSGVTVFYQDEVGDTESISEWAEFYVSNCKGDKSRKQSLDQRHLELFIGIFVKPGANLYRHWEILKDFKTALSNNYSMPITDFSSSAVVGHLRVLNMRIRPSTREIGNSGHLTIRHVQLRFPIIAQED